MTEDWGRPPREPKVDLIALADRIEARQPTNFGGPTGKTFMYPSEIKAVVAALRAQADVQADAQATASSSMLREARTLINAVAGLLDHLINNGKSQIVLEIAFEIEDGAIKSTTKTAKVSVP